MAEIAKLTIVLWYDGDAEEAAKFYAETFPDSSVGTIFRAPSDYPSGKAGDALTVEFTVLGRAFSGLNGGDKFTPNESVSFMVVTEDQEETDRYWNASGCPRSFMLAFMTRLQTARPSSSHQQV